MNGLLLVGIAVAGGGGAVIRLVVDTLLGRLTRRPIGTLVVNVSGSAVLGILTGLGAGTLGATWLAVLGTGLLGGYTTFSTAMVESIRLWADGHRLWAGVSAIGMMAAAVLAAMVGLACGLWLGAP